MKKIAVITGASAGLGIAFLKNIPARYPETQEIWAIQRRKADAQSYPIPIRSVQLDLTDRESYRQLEELLRTEQPDIQLLINNAGFGKIGDLAESEYHEQGRMVDLNVRAATVITTLCLPYMRRNAHIVNVASIAGFAPNPRMTVYSSTKAYLISFSKSLREELKPKGVHCMAVCSGPMHTEFLPVAGIQKGTSKTFDTLPYCDPDRVAEKALKLVQKNRAIYTPRLFYRFYRILAKLLPHNFIMKISKT